MSNPSRNSADNRERGGGSSNKNKNSEMWPNNGNTGVGHMIARKDKMGHGGDMVETVDGDGGTVCAI